MYVLVLRPYRKDNIYFRTIEEREKIIIFLIKMLGLGANSIAVISLCFFPNGFCICIDSYLNNLNNN